MTSATQMETRDVMERRGSVYSVQSTKRRRDEKGEAEPSAFGAIWLELKDSLFTESNKISKTALRAVLSMFAKFEGKNVELITRVANMEGWQMETRKKEHGIKKTFADVVGVPRLKVGKKQFRPNQ